MNETIARTWAERAQAELGAAQRFRNIANHLEERTAPPKLTQLARKAVQDEERHAFLCAKVATKWGHRSGFETPKNIDKKPPSSWHNLPVQDSFLLDMILTCCITESFNASLLSSIYAKSKTSEEGRIVHQILKDEVQHGQLGWAFLQWEAQQRDCTFVSDYLIEMLDLAIRDELFSSHHELASSSYLYGVMPHQDRLSQFQLTLEEVICPGFTHFGIDITPIQKWMKNKQRTITNNQEPRL